MAKRKTLFEEYAFEIGVLTLPAYLVLLMFGVIYMELKIGMALIAIGVIGSFAAIGSIKLGYKEIKW